jgi:hypothetical protein
MSTNLTEDAILELEALSAIYLSDFIPTNNGCIVIAKPSADETNKEAKVAARIEFLFSSTLYPSSEPPTIKVSSEFGLNEERCGELLTSLEKVAQDNVGLPSVFSIVENAREWLALRNFASDDSSHAKMLARENEKKLVQQKEEEVSGFNLAEQERKKKIIPKFDKETPITPETFNKWLTNYKKELAINQPISTEKKITGREIFEGKAGVSLQDLLKEEDKEMHDGQDHGQEEEDFDVRVFADEDDVSSLESD